MLAGADNVAARTTCVPAAPQQLARWLDADADEHGIGRTGARRRRTESTLPFTFSTHRSDADTESNVDAAAAPPLGKQQADIGAEHAGAGAGAASTIVIVKAERRRGRRDFGSDEAAADYDEMGAGTSSSRRTARRRACAARALRSAAASLQSARSCTRGEYEGIEGSSAPRLVRTVRAVGSAAMTR